MQLVTLISGCLAAVCLAGCGSLPLAQAAAAKQEAPQDPRTVSLNVTDLPGGLTLCPESGQIDSYLLHLQAEGSPSFEIVAAQWAAMKRMGATAGWVQSFAHVSDDCMARLGERKSPSATSFAIRFTDLNAAVSGFNSGFLGLRPEPGMLLPGLAHGVQTQLSPDAWTYDQTGRVPQLFAAFWANRTFDLFLLTEGVPTSGALHAASGMNDRVH